MNGRRRFLLGAVLSIQSSGFIYPACQNCCSRLTLTAGRYECHKCGSTYKDAAHRYKLSVKVSEERRLHVITVFGKCLEKIFGGSADFLHSHLQVSSQLSGDLGQAQDLLFQAAERCLIGRSFIFAVKIPGNFDRSDSLSHSNLQRNLVACQIILLNEDPMTCTVLGYFNQLVADILGNRSIHTKTDVSSDTTNRDLGDLEFSVRSSDLQSWNNYADYWQQSLGLVSSPLSSTLSQGEHSRTGLVQCSKDEISHNTTVSMQKKLNISDKAIHSSSAVSISTPGVKCSSFKHIHTRSPQRSSHFHSFSSKSKIALGQESYLQNICKSGSCKSQSCSALPPQPAEIHQVKEEIWEDFPFSESLSEFIAKIEDDDGVRQHFIAKESTMSTSNGKECRRSSTLMDFPGARPTQNCTIVKEASHCTSDKCSDMESNMCVFNHSLKGTRRNYAGLVHHNFPSATWNSFQQSFEKGDIFDVLSRASTKDQHQQSSTCPKMLSNGTYVSKGLDLCSFIEDLDKTAMSGEKGISSRRHKADDNTKSLDVDRAKVTDEIKTTMTEDHYNASADLFEASNDLEDKGTSQSQLIVSPNKGQERLLFSMTVFSCTDVLSYHHLSDNYETCNYLPTGGFIPNLQSTPILRRLSGTNRLSVDPWCLNMASNAKSSTVSIRTKSSSIIRHLFLKNMKQRNSAIFYGLSENYSLWSPFSNFDGSTALIPKTRRIALAHQPHKRGTENYDSQTCHNEGSSDELTCTVKRSDRRNTGGIKHGGDDTLDNIENLSPVNSSLQESEDQLCSVQEGRLLSDWSPELFSGKSSISQPSDHLQRRLF